MKRAIRQSRSKDEIYNNIINSVLVMVALGYDYESVLNWNVGAFFDIMEEVCKIQKAKAGIK